MAKTARIEGKLSLSWQRCPHCGERVRMSEKAIDGRYAEADSLGLRAEIAFDRTGTKCLTTTTCKACASSPGGQEKRNFGPIGPPYGSIIRAWNRCGMASKNLEVNRTFALSSTPFLRWHGPLLQTAPQTSSISAGWIIRVYLQSKLWTGDGRLRFIPTTCHEFWKHAGKL